MFKPSLEFYLINGFNNRVEWKFVYVGRGGFGILIKTDYVCIYAVVTITDFICIYIIIELCLLL